MLFMFLIFLGIIALIVIGAVWFVRVIGSSSSPAVTMPTCCASRRSIRMIGAIAPTWRGTINELAIELNAETVKS